MCCRRLGRIIGHIQSTSGTLLPYLSAAAVVFMDRIVGFGSHSLFGFALGQKCLKMSRQTISKNHTGEIGSNQNLWKQQQNGLDFSRIHIQ